MKYKILKNNFSKGFTIIELIVVIAIIAVLAGIVLVNVTQYINKGKDTAVKGDMRSLQTAATVIADNAQNGGDANIFCGNTKFSEIITNINNIYPGSATTESNIPYQYICIDSIDNRGCNVECLPGQWVFAKRLSDGTLWCVDSLGSSKAIGSMYGNGCTCDDICY